MIIQPSSSYQLHLPDDIVRDVDGSAVSFWRSGEPLLLQLSSHQRTHGNQVTAHYGLRNGWEKVIQSGPPDPPITVQIIGRSGVRRDGGGRDCWP